MPHALTADMLAALGDEWLSIKFQTGSFSTLEAMLQDSATSLLVLPSQTVCSSEELAAIRKNPIFEIQLHTPEPLNWKQLEFAARSTTRRASSSLCSLTMAPPVHGGVPYRLDQGGAVSSDSEGSGAPGSGAGSADNSSGISPDAGESGCYTREAERDIFLSCTP